MKKMIKLFGYLILVLSMMTAFCAYCYAADASEATFEHVLMNVGADETERNLNWYSNSGSDAYVEYSKDGGEVKTVKAVCNTITTDSCYSYKATLTGLSSGTWSYRIVSGGASSETYTFEVYDTADGYSFAFITDAQVGNAKIYEKWQENSKMLKNDFGDISFIVSAGDQTSNPMNETEFDWFITPELASLAVSTTVGPPHDNSMYYGYHYNLPNLSSTYGVSATSSDYFYTHSGVLFMHLNVENTNYAEHIEFMERTIADNSDCNWKIVLIHYSFFSGGNHSRDNGVKNFRSNLAGKFNELGIDVVLSGHDHVYSRSNMMLDDTTVSSDVVSDNTVTNPEGTLYLCGTSAGNSFYNDYYSDDAVYIAYREETNTPGTVIFDVTDTSLALSSYFFGETEPFDTFTILKDKNDETETADFYNITYVTDCTLSYGDDISDFSPRRFTNLTPDAPLAPVPYGSFAEGVLYDWAWEYRNSDGDVVTSFEYGNDYYAYLVSEETPVSEVMYIAGENDSANFTYTWQDAFGFLQRFPCQNVTFKLKEDITLTSSDAVELPSSADVVLDLDGYTFDAAAVSNLFTFPKSKACKANVKIITSSPSGKLVSGSTGLFYLYTNSGSSINVEIGSVDTEKILIEGKYIFYGDKNFRHGSTLNLYITNAECTVSSGVIYVYNLNATDTVNNYNLTLKSSVFNFSGSSSCIVRSAGNDYYTSTSSFIKAEGCTFKDTYTADNSASRYLIREDIWKGTVTFNDCDLVGMSIGKTLSGAAIKNSSAIILGEGTTLKNSNSTFNGDGFFSSKVKTASGCVAAHVDENTVEIVKSENAALVTWASPVGFSEYWKIGEVPVYSGETSFTAGDITFNIVLSETPVFVTEDVTYSFETEEGYLLKLNEETQMWQISTDGGKTYQDITEEGEIEVKYVLTVTVDDAEKKYTAVPDFMEILTEYSDAAYANKTVNITLLEDLSFTTAGTFIPQSGTRFIINLQGHKLTSDASERITINTEGFYLHIFSSEEGGQLVFNSTSDGLQIGRSGTLILGSETYKNKLTVTASGYLVNFATLVDRNITVKYLYCTVNSGNLGILRLSARGDSTSTVNAEVIGCNVNGSTSLVFYNSSSNLSASAAGGVYTKNSCISFKDSTFKRTTTNPKDFFGNANFTDRYYGTVSFENCTFDTYILNGDLIYSDEVLEYNDYYSTLTDYDPTKAINVGEGCMFKNYGATFNSDLSAFAAANVNIPENCTLAVQGDYVVVVPADGVVIDLGEKQAEANVRYIEANGVRKETAFDEYYVPSSSTDHIVAVIEKTSDDTAELVKSEYYYVDMTAKKATKLNMDSYMHAYDEKSIRIKEPMGIRFKAHILTAQKYEETDFVIDEYGYIVATEKHLDGSELTFDTQKKATAVGYSREEGINTVFEATDEMHIFTGILNNIPVKEYKTNLVCKTYTKITVNGKQFVLYGEAVTGNVYETAQKLLEADPGNVELIKIVLDGEGSIGVDIGGLYD